MPAKVTSRFFLLLLSRGRACPARLCKEYKRLSVSCGPHVCGPYRSASRLFLVLGLDRNVPVRLGLDAVGADIAAARAPKQDRFRKIQGAILLFTARPSRFYAGAVISASLVYTFTFAW